MPSSTPEPDLLVRLEEVSFGYDRELVLERVSLDIHRGDALAVIGPNGGGKTTLARLLIGLEKPWSGRVVRQLGGPGNVGYVPQFPQCERAIPLSVEEVVAMGRLGRRGLLGRYGEEDRARVREALAACRLDRLARSHFADLSGGQLQRALLARALVSSPELLVLDEPLASVDPGFKDLFGQILATLGHTVTLVVIAHDLTPLTGHIRQIACVNRFLHYHESGELDREALQKIYGEDVGLVTHGIPHIVLPEHP